MSKIELRVDGAVVWESGRQPEVQVVRESAPVTTARDAAFLFRSLGEMGQQEVFAAAYLDNSNHVLDVKWLTIGLLDTAPIHPREVFAPAIALRATAVIVAHNHTSGALNPSPEDMAMTRRLAEASRILGFRFLDHVIVANIGGGEFSWTALRAEHGDLFEATA